jgi:DNA-binding protein HU-beta
MAKTAVKKAPPKKTASPKTKTASSVVTLKHLAAEVAASHDLAKTHAEAILTETMDSIRKHLKKGSKIRIVGLGILQVKKREARMGRNPATGEAIKIKASRKVAFRASKELKEAV